MNLTFYVMKSKGLEFGLDTKAGDKIYPVKNKKSLTQGQAFLPGGHL